MNGRQEKILVTPFDLERDEINGNVVNRLKNGRLIGTNRKDTPEVTKNPSITGSGLTKPKSFLRVRTFVACMSLLQLVQVMGSGYGKSALTSIERRYQLSTFSIGVLQSCFPIGNLSVILFVSYFGSKWHRPRAIAIGSLIMATSSLLSCLPQFVGGRYKVDYAIMSDMPENEQPITGGMTFQKHEPKIELAKISGLDKNILSANGLSAEREQRDHVTATADYISSLGSFAIKRNTSRLASRFGGDQEFRRDYGPRSAVDFNRLHSMLMTAPNASANSAGSVSLQYLCKPPTMSDTEWNNLRGNISEESSEGDTKEDDTFLYFFIAVGSILKGIGHSPLHPLGMSFIDDFASGSNSAVYIGVISALSLLGPAFGFILGSLTTNIWVDSGWVNTTQLQIQPQDSEWVGAWWMGYLITGFLLFLATIPFCIFPRVVEKEEECLENETGCFSRLKSCLSGDEEEADSDPEDEKKGCEECGSDPIHPREDSIFRFVLDPDDLTSKSMDFDLGGQNLLHPKVEAVRAERSLTVCSCGEEKTGKRDGIMTSHRGRFPRSLSTPAISYTYKGRAARALSIHPSDCGFDKVVWKQNLNTSTSTASLKDFAFTLKNLLRDPVFISITMGFVSLTSFLASSITFASKYMETQFDLSASAANLLNGSVNLPMAVVGNLVGGWIIRRRNLTVKRTLHVVIIALFLTLLAISFLLFWGCDNDNIVAITGQPGESSCSESCGCENLFFPVCHKSSNLTYRSPCHAGCASSGSNDHGVQTFTDCRCLTGSQNQFEFPDDNKVIAGACPQDDCWDKLSIFVVVMGIASMTAGMSSTPSTLTILRVAPPSDKAFAIGIVFVFTRVLAWIPSPVYVGSAIDSSCLVWMDQDLTNSRQHCEFYDKRRLRQTFFGCTSLQLLLASFFYTIALYLVTMHDKERGKLQPGIRRSEV